MSRICWAKHQTCISLSGELVISIIICSDLWHVEQPAFPLHTVPAGPEAARDPADLTSP